jgi:hypothetical protein
VASGVQVFYETSLTAGRRSTGIQGVLDIETALRTMLEGSGLAARTIAVNTISIVQPPPDPALSQAKRAALQYYGFMQAGIMDALCRSAKAKPGNYHATMQYWLDRSGRIAQFKLIGTSGDAERDSAVAEAIRMVAFEPRLASLPQPITLVIAPAQKGASAVCTPGGNDAAQVK